MCCSKVNFDVTFLLYLMLHILAETASPCRRCGNRTSGGSEWDALLLLFCYLGYVHCVADRVCEVLLLRLIGFAIADVAVVAMAQGTIYFHPQNQASEITSTPKIQSPHKTDQTDSHSVAKISCILFSPFSLSFFLHVESYRLSLAGLAYLAWFAWSLCSFQEPEWKSLAVWFAVCFLCFLCTLHIAYPRQRQLFGSGGRGAHCSVAWGAASQFCWKCRLRIFRVLTYIRLYIKFIGVICLCSALRQAWQCMPFITFSDLLGACPSEGIAKFSQVFSLYTFTPLRGSKNLRQDVLRRVMWCRGVQENRC